MGFAQMLKENIPYNLRKKIWKIVGKKSGFDAVFERLDKDIVTIFDIGANVGDITNKMLYFFRKATVYSFEPCFETNNTCARNIAKAGYGDRSRLYRLGFYDDETLGKLNVTSFHGANSMIEICEDYHEANPHIHKVRTEDIPLMRLDDFVAQNGIDHIDLVKIDVEGVEKQILLGGKETFSTKVDTVILEVCFMRHPRESGEVVKLLQIMHDYGFSPSDIIDIDYGDNKKWRLGMIDMVFRRY